jgi:hypothetical protein
MNFLKISDTRLKSVFLILIFIRLTLFCFPNDINRQRNIIIQDCPIEDTIGKINGIFDIPELEIQPSPGTVKSFTFSKLEKVIDYDVSPAGVDVAAIVENVGGRNLIKFWQIGKSELSDSCLLPDGLQAKAIAWHPGGSILFILGEKETGSQIFRVEKNRNNWITKRIFSTPNHLRRLVVSPRPFIISSDSKKNQKYYSYRIFLGMDNGDNSYRIVSITETGKRFYQVVGPSKTFTKPDEDEIGPSAIEADWALPIAFHPAGHQLIWENKSHNFFVANYNLNSWNDSKPMKIDVKGNGTILPTPNGLGVIHWQKDIPGIGVYLFSTKKEEIQIPEYRFVSAPSSVPDGKGIVGLTFSNEQYALNYVPIDVPLADVVNAWMFAKTNEEIDLFQKHFGLFRPDQYDQLYELYDSENYYCGDYDRNSPTRPYLVTTDIFWELFGAAYQGLFIVKERDEAIPNFWKFVNEADNYIKITNKISDWAPVFTALKDFNSGNVKNPEVVRIQKEQDCITELINKEYAYSDLKPRGHYTSTPEMEKYFKAFRYFTTIYKSNQDTLKELNSLPEEIKVIGEKWIESYSGFISPSRSPMVWNNQKNKVPKYCQYPAKELSIFPLSWGFDNEVLYSTIYHNDLPSDFQIKGPYGFRLLPSGIDLASVLGNGLADSLLESDYMKFPSLRKVIDNLKGNFKNNSKGLDIKDNLYNQWINALSVQWADTVNSTNGGRDKGIWQTKRLQTGLASWATLRHATILVNERISAECGEGGFEEIIMRAPRGYVEPDPNTFSAIADLFETAVKYVSKSIAEKSDIREESDDAEKRSLYDGIVNRLNEAARDARAFQFMAEKERKGELLTNKENEKILYVARTGEHLFLVFNSLSNKDYALSNPDPMAKIADVAGGGLSSYLMSAVGNAMEWNFIMPFYGRHQIVKGSVYSYYEFTSKQLLNDNKWREEIKSQEILPWIKPYITIQNAAGKPVTCY